MVQCLLASIAGSGEQLLRRTGPEILPVADQVDS